MINGTDLPRKLWAEAVNTAVHVLNRVPTSSNPDKTPYELWFRCKPNVKNLRIFGQKAIVNRPVLFRDGKWDTTGDKMRLVGYTQLLNTYRFYSPEKNRIIISCNATFLDNELHIENLDEKQYIIDTVKNVTKHHVSVEMPNDSISDLASDLFATDQSSFESTHSAQMDISAQD